MQTGQIGLHAFRPETRTAVDAVSRALDLTTPGTGAPEIMPKGGRVLVTATDVAVEDATRERLTEAFSLPVVGEERGGAAPVDGSPYWLLDPICGPRNFASGIPLYCVNLALAEGERVAVAVVGDPSTGEIALAERDRGAWAIKGNALRPLATSDESATIVIEDGKAKAGRREHAARFIAAAIRTDRWYVRTFGTTLSLPYLAAGRVCAHVDVSAPALHTAPGSLLVYEAGGTLSDIAGRPWTIHSDSLLAAANEELHADLLDLARSAAPGRD